MRSMSETGHASSASRIAAVAGCCAIWGSTFLVIRLGNASLPPIWAACLRLLLASACLWAWMALRRHAPPRGRALVSALQYGVCQFGLNFPLLYWGETIVPSGLSAVFYATTPITLMLLARAFGLERLSAGKVAGALVALLGIVLIFSSELSARVPWPPLLGIFVSTLVAGFGSTLLKRGPVQSAVGVNAVGCGIGAAFCLLWSFVFREPHPLPVTRAALFPVLYLTAAGSLGAFVLWTWLVHTAPLSKIGYIAVITPLVALTLGALIGRERIAPLTLVGAAVVLVGVAIGLRAPAARALRTAAAHPTR
jgi:drug/metabolite transporter (DMT)-like permease